MSDARGTSLISIPDYGIVIDPEDAPLWTRVYPGNNDKWEVQVAYRISDGNIEVHSLYVAESEEDARKAQQSLANYVHSTMCSNS